MKIITDYGIIETNYNNNEYKTILSQPKEMFKIKLELI